MEWIFLGFGVYNITLFLTLRYCFSRLEDLSVS